MFDFDVVRAWKDAKYRRSLTPQQLARLPENPAGMVELSDEKLRGASGAFGKPPPQTTAVNCTLYSFLNWTACGCGLPTTAPTCTVYTWQGWAACGC